MNEGGWMRDSVYVCVLCVHCVCMCVYVCVCCMCVLCVCCVLGGVRWLDCKTN